MSTPEASAFPRSKKAARTAVRTGMVRPAFTQAHGAPENYLAHLSAGEHPLVAWINQLEMSPESAAASMNVTLPQYESLLGDKEGAFHKITSAMVLSFSDNLGIHPAHLGTLVADFRYSSPSAIYAANLRMMEDTSYSVEDRALARCAVKAERNRYYQSFIGDPEFGRAAEKLEAFWETWKNAYLLNKHLRHEAGIWSWDSNAQIALEAVESDLKQQIDTNEAKIITQSKGIKARTEGFYKKFGDIVRQETRTTNPMAVVARSVDIVKECAKQFDIVGQKDELRLKDALARVIGINFGKKNSSVIQMAAQMCIYFFEDRLETADAIRKMEGFNEILRDELNNTEEWIAILGDRGNPKGQIVSRLFANRCLGAEYDHLYAPDPTISALLQPRPRSWGS